MINPTKPSGPMYFDIETSARDEAEILPLAPNFKAPANYKDTDKIEAYIAGERAEWLRAAALSAVSGKVLCVGLLQGSQFTCIGSNKESEKAIIENFWSTYQHVMVSFVGFSIKHFDLPFLVRRSYALKIQIPYTVRDGRYWSSRFMDLQEKWTLGDNRDLISLDRLSKYLGLGSKLGNGADFAGLWSASREAAIDYLKQDLRLTQAVAARMEGRDCEPLPQPEDDDRLLF